MKPKSVSGTYRKKTKKRGKSSGGLVNLPVGIRGKMGRCKNRKALWSSKRRKKRLLVVGEGQVNVSDILKTPKKGLMEKCQQ